MTATLADATAGQRGGLPPRGAVRGRRVRRRGTAAAGVHGLFGLRVAVRVLTLTQIASNAGRVWFNRSDLGWRLIGRFCLGAVPFAVVGALLLAAAPLGGLQRLLGVFLIGVCS